MTEYIEVPSKMNGYNFQFKQMLRITRISDQVEWFSTDIYRLFKMTLIPMHVIKPLLKQGKRYFEYEGKKYILDSLRM